ncbi:MAG: hypothetical protein DMC57_03260, partial [Verrucomicrobia bacterium]
FVQTAEMAERQPDLFSPRPAAVPHESPEFVEEQLAKLEATQIGQPLAEPAPPEEQPVAEERPESADFETPRESQPQPEETTPPAATPSNGDSEPEEAKRGFFSRLLRRTDY